MLSHSPGQRADHDEQQRDEQDVDAEPLALRLVPLTSGPMNRPAASQAVAIQKMPELHVPGAGHAVGQPFESGMP